MDVVTIFHKSSVAQSTRALALLKQAAAQASETATEDQASDHTAQNKIQRNEFELNVTEEPPTSDQLRSIFEYIGQNRVKDVVKGSSTVSEAIKLLQEDKNRFQPPVVCYVSLTRAGPLTSLQIVDWNNGKAGRYSSRYDLDLLMCGSDRRQRVRDIEDASRGREWMNALRLFTVVSTAFQK